MKAKIVKKCDVSSESHTVWLLVGYENIVNAIAFEDGRL